MLDSERVPVGGSPVRGRPDALVTIVEFSDFQCPFCNRVLPTLERILNTYGNDVRIVFKHLPLPFHQNAMLAAEAAMEVRAQLGDEGFWRYHDILFANQRALSRQDLERYAERLQIDMTRFRDALDQRIHRPAIERDIALAQQLGLQGTPSFLINGTELAGARPYEQFTEVIDRVLAHARTIQPRERVYAEMTAHPLPGPEIARPSSPPPQHPPLDPDARYRVPDEGAPSRGPADALVTIVEFSDFQCPFCARAQTTLEELRRRYGRDLRIVWRHHPLNFHPHAMLAAEAAHEAFVQQGERAFWRFHDLLFSHQRDPGGLERPALEQYARQIGLDVQRFRRALDEHTHQWRIQQDIQLAESIASMGTPEFFINGRRLTGAQPIERFIERIDRELAEARTLVRHGTPRARVYQTTIANGATQPVYLSVPPAPTPTQP